MGRTINQERKDFYKALLSLVIPITIQSLINSAVNSADVFMLGYVSQSALSAVSLANQMQFIVTGFFWGSTSGVALMVAQYWGKGDKKTIQKVMGIGMKISFLFTALIAIASFAAPGLIMHIFTNDSELIAIGSGYLRIIAFSYVLQSASQIYGASMKSMNRAGVATAISTSALFINVILNALFIFGWMGFPKLGVVGVAIATLIARILEVVFCIVDAVRCDDFMKFDPKLMLTHDALLTKDFLKFAIPAILNDISWTVAFSTYSIILGHLGNDAVAASAVATTIRDLSTVVCMSLGQAAVSILGHEIGSGKLVEAKRDGRRMVVLSIVLGAITGVIILIMIPMIVKLFPLSAVATDYMKFMLMISSYYVIGQSVNTAIITGIFRAGGDTKFGMWCDTINMWCVSVPIGFICAFVLKLPVKVVYVILCLDEFYKIPVEYIHYKKYKWLNDVTR